MATPSIDQTTLATHLAAFFADLSEVNAQLDAIQASLQGLDARLAALEAKPAPVKRAPKAAPEASPAEAPAAPVAPAKEQTVVVQPVVVKPVTLDEARTAFLQYVATQGRDAGLALLAKYSAKKLSDVPVEKLPELVGLAK